MNFKRVMAGALAGSMVAALSVAPVFADGTEYHGYFGFQTPKYSFRNACDDESYGLNGTSNTADIDYSVVHAWDADNNLVSAEGSFTDATITGDGTYTVSVSGLNWGADEFGDKPYNLLFLSTDIPVDALNSGLEITVDEFKVGDKAVALDPAMVLNNWEDVDPEDELTTGIQVSIQNIWSDNKDIGDYDTSASEMSITFTVKGLDDYAAATGDTTPVVYLAALVAVAGVAMVASKKARA